MTEAGPDHPRPARGRLVLRIYLVVLVTLALIAGLLIVIRMRAMEPPSLVRQHAAYIARSLTSLRNDGPRLAAGASTIQKETGTAVTIYTAEGVPLANTAEIPYPPLPRRMVTELPLDGRRLRGGIFVIPMLEEGQVRGYILMHIAPPRFPWPELALEIAMILGCLALASLLLARMMAKPLERIAAAARAFGSGDLGARSRVRRRDELGEVSRAFDEMAGRITTLLQSQRELLANVSHEFRTPLARIRVALDIAAEGDLAMARESLRDIAEDLGELEGLVEDVLTAARLDAAVGSDAAAGSSGSIPPLRTERVLLRDVIERPASGFRSAHPERELELEQDDGAEDAEVEADPSLLRRVVDNLLENAAKYSEPSTAVCLSLRTEPHRAVIQVSDQGIGISPADLPHVFTPFYRADKSRSRATGGFGLGLPLARKIVDAHHGTIDIASQPGQGTTVTVRLPLQPP